MNYLKLGAKYFLLPVVLVAIGAVISSIYLINTAKTLSADGNWFGTPTGIDRSEVVTLGDVEQFIRIRGRDKNNPILLDLHGGPGSALSPISHRLLRPLTEYFTLVEWDQRGAGRSIGDTSLVETMSYDRIVDDTIELIDYLNVEFGTEKVILVGHSWGSMLGLGVIKKRPDLIHAYVGVGQALAWPGGFDETQRLLLEAARQAGDAKTVETLEALPEAWPPAEDIDRFLDRVGTIQAPMQHYETSLHASMSNNILTSDLVLDVVLSPEIGIFEAFSMLDVSDATKALMIDLFGRDLRIDFGAQFDVPLFIFQGEHDWQTPTTLVKPWFDRLEAPYKSYVAFEDSAHMIINEQPGKFLVELVTKVRPFALQTKLEGLQETPDLALPAQTSD